MALLGPDELHTLAAAEDIAGRHHPPVPGALVAAGGVWHDGPAPAKQWQAILGWLGQHPGVELGGVAFDPDAVVALAVALDADLILAAMAPRDDEVLVRSGFRVEYVRAPAGRRLEVDRLIRDMARRGGDVDTIARLLGLPPAHVRFVLGVGPAQRPRIEPDE